MSNLDIIRGRQVVATLTNKSGGSVIAGDVVIIDTSTDESFTTTTTAALERSIGVAQETIANNAAGRVLLSGYAALVNVSASATRGHYLFTHTVAKQATSSATRVAGAFGQIIKAGTTPSVWLWGVADQTASGGAAVPTWEDVVADLSGKVHRWKFEEASGDFNDEISTLDLTAVTTITYQAASPLGFGASFTGGYAESTGLGSIPVADAARTILAVWKKTALGTSANLPIISYGTATTRTMFQLYGTSISVLSGNYFTDAFNVGVGAVMDGQWHMSALMNGTTRIQAGYHDGQLSGQTGGANLNTSAANNFHVAAEYDDTDPAAITVTDVIVFDRMLLTAELDRLWNALRVLLDGS